jgi:pimeloyl-ACP methyl ester carboxylesterase
MTEYFYKAKNLYYRVNEFRRNRPTLVFIHGLSGSSSAWAPYEQKFETEYNLLTFDLRGHGKSEKPKNYSDYAVEKFAGDLFFLLAHLKITGFILVSHSFGTLIALEFLTEHQAIAKAAIFLSPSFSPDERLIARAVRPLLAAAKIFKLLPASTRPRGHIDYRNHLNTGDWNIRRMFADIHNTGLRVYLYCSRQSCQFDRRNFLSEITIPVLIVHGKKDTIFPVKSAITIADKIKKCRLILLDNADHIIVLNNFSAVAEAIKNFVAADEL